ncbi:hypothetical protein [Streptomyces sp. NPDC018610]|uniref:hypothetical protein n=1 Tax=Streptomyces sp. NPDC018610 TaxID=3365049 RepID=UPI00379E24AE
MDPARDLAARHGERRRNGDHAAGNTGGVLADDVLVPAVVTAPVARDVRDVRRAGSGRGRTARPAA